MSQTQGEEEEEIPLMDSTNLQNTSMYPPFVDKDGTKSYQPNGPSTSLPNYGGLGLPPGQTAIEPETKERMRIYHYGGIFGSPIFAIIVIVVGLVLIFTLAITFTPSGLENSSQNGESGANLRATAQQQSAAHPKLRLSQSPPQSHVDIEISQGRLRGYKKLSRDGKEYSAFFKVPYAEPPIGSLRFKDPVAPSSWEGLRDIPVVAPQCIQKEKYDVAPTASGEEDCLYANVYTPRLPQTRKDEDTNKLFPVMVYIHGGGFSSGNGSRYGADYFMDEDVVLITFQFRLGPFGFLPSTGDGVIPGNLGLRDQVQMLKWVRENAKYFNGNPDLILIYGNSSGGSCVGWLLLAPMANGLFHRAISQSGTGTTGQTVNETVGRLTMEEVGRAVGCPTEDSQKYLECLLEKDAEELALSQGEHIMYAASIENLTGKDDESASILLEKPFRSLQSGRFHPVPYIIGANNAEGYGGAMALLQNENVTKLLNDRFEDATFESVDLSDEEMKKVKEIYFGDKRIGNETLKELADMFGDVTMVYPSYLTARYHATQANAYLYWLTKPPAKSYFNKFIPGFPVNEMGLVSHADELQYLFLYDGYPEIKKDDPEYYQFSKYLVKLWAHFARTGNPTMDGVEWSAVNEYGKGFSNSTFWLELNDKPARTTVLQGRMGLWDQFDLKDINSDWI